MNLRILSGYSDIEHQPFEVVERKGIGHPDTLADMIADEFSSRYSLHCLRRFGVIPHHWADKVTVVGGKSQIGFGKATVQRPIRVYQFGRTTPGIGNATIDVQGLFRSAVREVFSRVFASSEIIEHLQCRAVVHDGSGPDHPREFYNPQSPSDVKRTQVCPKANDTAVIVAYAGYSRTEILAIELENYLNSDDFKARFPETGADIKVLIVRDAHTLNATICIPFLASRTPSLRAYKGKLDCIHSDILEKASSSFPELNLSLRLNTKDTEEGVYLTAFGTAADKGDCGAVGRGNRFNGVISPNREMSIEAPSGKNPTHHVGKLYNELAFRIARDVYLLCGQDNYVNIVSRNGDDLDSPSVVCVKCIGEAASGKPDISDVVETHLDSVGKLTRQVVERDPVADHIHRPRQLYECRIEHVSRKLV